MQIATPGGEGVERRKEWKEMEKDIEGGGGGGGMERGGGKREGELGQSEDCNKR